MRSIKNLMDISGRKALITGGAGHIGLAVGETLVELGATVAVLDRDAADCDQRVASLTALGPGKALAVPCNLEDEQAVRDAVKTCASTLGGLDILIHCAAHVGTTESKGWAVPFEEQTVEAWDAAMRVNLTSAFILVQESKESLDASGRGSVILIGSIYGLVGPDMKLYTDTGMVNPAGYSASKGGTLQLARYLATTLAPEIRVNAISPGGVWRGQDQKFHQRYKDKTPLGRMAIEEDLKGAVAYLSSDMSAYMTGHNLVVDGGWTAW